MDSFWNFQKKQVCQQELFKTALGWLAEQLVSLHACANSIVIHVAELSSIRTDRARRHYRLRQTPLVAFEWKVDEGIPKTSWSLRVFLNEQLIFGALELHWDYDELFRFASARQVGRVKIRSFSRSAMASGFAGRCYGSSAYAFTMVRRSPIFVYGTIA